MLPQSQIFLIFTSGVFMFPCQPWGHRHAPHPCVRRGPSLNQGETSNQGDVEMAASGTVKLSVMGSVRRDPGSTLSAAASEALSATLGEEELMERPALVTRCDLARLQTKRVAESKGASWL